MPCIWFFCLSPVGVFCQESSIFRIVVSGIQVIEPCRAVIDTTCITYLIPGLVISFDRCFPEVRIPINCIRCPVFFDQAGGASLDVFIIEIVGGLLTIVTLRSNDVSFQTDQVLGCLFSFSIGRIRYHTVLIVIVCRRVSFDLPDSLIFSIILVLLDHSGLAVFCHDSDFTQTVPCIVSFQSPLTCFRILYLCLVSAAIIRILTDRIDCLSFFHGCCLDLIQSIISICRLFISIIF